MKSISYKQAECCSGQDCDYHNNKEFCWGQVDVIDEIPIGNDDFVWLHACQGHRDLYYGGGYIKELT